jgi:uncharacterized protein YndB with AHSA1/START domain
MTDAGTTAKMEEIVIDDVFPHAPVTIWNALATGELIDRWLMPQQGFAASVGSRFFFQTPPSGDWDGRIQCEVLEAVPNERLVYSWKSGVQTAEGYVPRLDTIVTWTLTPLDSGTRLRLVHSGFVMPKNEAVYRNINAGWSGLIPKLMAIAEKLA